MNLTLLLQQLKSLNSILIKYDAQIDALATSPYYQEPVQALTCYKGIKNLFALTRITEIGVSKRFSYRVRNILHWSLSPPFSARIETHFRPDFPL